MKKIYLIFLFLSSLCYSQDEALLGQWTLDSIFDTDIYLIDPINPISAEFHSDTNSITIESFCGETHQSLYTNSTDENTIIITESNWDPSDCSEDNQGWENAMSSIFRIYNSNPKNLTYIITDNGTTTSLEIGYSYIWQGITTDITGYFTKQNTPSEQLLGTWYLYTVYSDGINHENDFGNLPIVFLEGVNDYYEFIGTSSCNGFSGNYIVNNETIEVTVGSVTLADCPGPRNGFEMTYLSLFYNPDNFFTFDIQGSDLNQTLTLSKSNGDYIVYGKIEPNSILNRTWYLETVNSDGLTYDVSPVSSAYLTLDTTLNQTTETLELYGSGDCNNYTGNYLQGNNSITITEFTATTDICNPQTDFEVIYFSLLGDNTPNTFAFEITNDGNNLILTSLPDDETRSTGDTLVYSRQILSVRDNQFSNSTITLQENPVENELKLNLNESIIYQPIKYTIYSIEGKTIKSSTLNNKSININTLQLGVYFISFSTATNLISTTKFIKK